MQGIAQRATIRRDEESFEVWVHPSFGARAIIINCPGYKGSIEGYKNKYVTLADHLAERGVGAVVRMPNIERSAGAAYREGLVGDVRAVIAWVTKVSLALTGDARSDIYLMGFSAGGFAVASASAGFPQVKKLLLMEPTVNASLVGALGEDIGRFEGEAYIVVGDHEAVGLEAAHAYRRALSGASRVEIQMISGCDHQFRGRRNGQIMAKAPFWAFADDKTFPSPEGGVVLY
jgi:dienelactone hydrolase